MSTPFFLDKKGLFWMERKKQYELLQLEKKNINAILGEGGFDSIKKLQLYLSSSKAYVFLKPKDSQLNILHSLSKLWFSEKKKLLPLGIEEDIFYNVRSLDDMEQKYLAVKYCALRIENKLPKEYCQQAIEDLAKYKLSGFALASIVIRETHEREQNVVEFSRMLKENNNMIDAMLMLEQGLEIYPGNREMLLEEADIWLADGQIDKALLCLNGIEDKEPEIVQLITELKGMIETNGTKEI